MSKVALCCGINDYEGVGSDLSGCVNDAIDVSEALTIRGFTVDTMLDSDATSVAIAARLKAMIAAAKYGDIVVFHFSGHGSYVPDTTGDEPDGRDEILVTYDIEQGRWLEDDALAEIFGERERGVRIVFLADSCHSGTVSRFSTQISPRDGSTRVRFLPPATFLKESTRGLTSLVPTRMRPRKVGGSSLLLSGTDDLTYSYDAVINGRPNGAFTRALLDSLAELHSPANYLDLWKKVRTKLPSAEYPQYPAILGERHIKRWGIFEEGR
jgi:hypothetical protein